MPCEPGRRSPSALRVQVSPPSAVCSATPSEPVVTKPWVASRKRTSVSRSAVPDACTCQLVPPSVVCRMVPPTPTPQPRSLSRKNQCVTLCAVVRVSCQHQPAKSAWVQERWSTLLAWRAFTARVAVRESPAPLVTVSVTT